MAFAIGDKVKTSQQASTQRVDGIVKYTACKAATLAGGRTCDKKTCNHNPQDYAWVRWPDGAIVSYFKDELELVSAATIALTGTLTGIGNQTIADSSKLTDKAVDKTTNAPKPNPAIDAGYTLKQLKDFVNSQQPGSKESLQRPLENNEIDWDAYNGFNKRKKSYRL